MKLASVAYSSSAALPVTAVMQEANYRQLINVRNERLSYAQSMLKIKSYDQQYALVDYYRQVAKSHREFLEKLEDWHHVLPRDILQQARRNSLKAMRDLNKHEVNLFDTRYPFGHSREVLQDLSDALQRSHGEFRIRAPHKSDKWQALVRIMRDLDIKYTFPWIAKLSTEDDGQVMTNPDIFVIQPSDILTLKRGIDDMLS